MTTNRRISTNEAERLLNGEPTNRGSDELFSLMASLRASGPPAVEGGLLERLTIEAAAIAGRSQGAPTGSSRIAAAGLGLRRRIATVAAAMTLVLGSGAGAAFAADGAAPGDPLYGFDIALESVAVGDGGAAERLEEAAALVAAGHVADGLEHAAEVLAADHGDESEEASEIASEALREAATRVAATADPGGGTNTAQVQTAVGDVLTYLAENIGDVDGSRVAELSQLIGKDVLG